jgi:hypothetical protein
LIACASLSMVQIPGTLSDMILSVFNLEFPQFLPGRLIQCVLGQGSTGVETSFRTPPSGEPWGYHLAFNPLTGKAEWKVPVTDTVLSAGMLATDGGLLFTGRVNGEFIASTGFRRRSGAPLIRDAQVRVPPPRAESLGKFRF